MHFNRMSASREESRVKSVKQCYARDSSWIKDHNCPRRYHFFARIISRVEFSLCLHPPFYVSYLSFFPSRSLARNEACASPPLLATQIFSWLFIWQLISLLRALRPRLVMARKTGSTTSSTKRCAIQDKAPDPFRFYCCINTGSENSFAAY